MGLPLLRNVEFNIAICTYCHIGIPFDWISGHLKDNHGLKCDDEEILEHLEIEHGTMQSREVKDWFRGHRVLPEPVDGIPVLNGFGCSACPYSAKKTKAIYNHVSTDHRNDVERPKVVERKVQKLFESNLKQYVQIEKVDEQQEDVPDWKQKLDDQFNGMMRNLATSAPSEGLDMRLMNAFIAKIR